MPSKQEKEPAKKVNTQPSPGILQRLLGSSQFTPEIEEGINIARRENPNLAPVKPYGPLSRMLMSQAQGFTSPARNIYLNPAQLAGSSPQDVADTLIHEQTHVNQMGPSSLVNFLKTFEGSDPYHRRPDEMEAFTAEINRRNRMGRSQTAAPSFMTGEYYVPRGDIHLPPEKGVKIGPTSTSLKKQQVRNATK